MVILQVQTEGGDLVGVDHDLGVTLFAEPSHELGPPLKLEADIEIRRGSRGSRGSMSVSKWSQ